MFSNIALDVAIGLFFIYALYSLLATTITELIASIFNERGKYLRKGIQRMLDSDTEETNTKENFSDEFFKLPQIKYLGRKLKNGKVRYPSYIKPVTFAKGFLNTLGYIKSEASSLSELKAKLNSDNETHQMIIHLIDEAEGSVSKFQKLLEEWFNETMDRAAGWYKRRIQTITFCVGLIIALGLNLNTIEISKKLGTDPQMRLAMVEAASEYAKNSQEKPNVELSKKVHDLFEESQEVTSIMEIKYPSVASDATWESWFSYLFGCLITAIALSLGAPFWFDLLNRLIKLRGSGSQEKTDTPTK